MSKILNLFKTIKEICRNFLHNLYNVLLTIYKTIKGIFEASPPINLRFSRANWKTFEDFVGSTKKRLDLATKILTPKTLENILSSLSSGVTVRVIYERTSKNGSFPKLKELLEHYNLEIIRCPWHHARFWIKDGKNLLIGSSNLTESGLGRDVPSNLEANVISRKQTVVDKAEALFNIVWEGKSDISELENETKILTSAYGIPSKIEEKIKHVQDELCIVAPLRFEQRFFDKSLIRYIRDLNQEATIRVVTHKRILERNIDEVKRLQSLSGINFKFVEEQVHAKAYIFDWEEAFISSLNLKRNSWINSLETGIMITNQLSELKTKIRNLEEKQKEIRKEEVKPPPTPSAPHPHYIREVDLNFDPEVKDKIQKFTLSANEAEKKIKQSKIPETISRAAKEAKQLKKFDKKNRKTFIKQCFQKAVNLINKSNDLLQISRTIREFQQANYGEQLLKKIANKIGIPTLAKKTGKDLYRVARCIKELKKIDKKWAERFANNLPLPNLVKGFDKDIEKTGGFLREAPEKVGVKLIGRVGKSLSPGTFADYFAREIESELNLKKIRYFLEGVSQIDPNRCKNIVNTINISKISDKLQKTIKPKTITYLAETFYEASGKKKAKTILKKGKIGEKIANYPDPLECARAIQKINTINNQLATNTVKKIDRDIYWERIRKIPPTRLTKTIKKIANANIGWQPWLSNKLNEDFDIVCRKIKKKELNELTLCAQRLSHVDDLGQQVIEKFSVNHLWNKIHKQLQKAKLDEVRISIKRVNQLSKEVTNQLLNKIVRYLTQQIENIREKDTALTPQKVSCFLKKVKNLDLDGEGTLNEVENLIKEMEKLGDEEDEEGDEGDEGDEEGDEGDEGDEEGDEGDEERIIEIIRQGNITPMVQKVNTGGWREGKGFSLAELEEAGLSKEIRNLLRQKHYVDTRRRSCHKRNVKVLRKISSSSVQN